MKDSYFKMIFFFFAVIMFQANSFAQTEETQQTTVQLVRDYRVDEIAAKQYMLNKKKQDASTLSKYKTSGGKYKGYRLMVLNTNDRELAYQTRGQLATQYPQHTLYLAFQAPYYKLKMGDFLEKKDAEGLKKQLTSFMKQGVFVVSDVVNIKPEEEEKLIEKLSKD